jgi:hypothetical protein
MVRLSYFIHLILNSCANFFSMLIFSLTSLCGHFFYRTNTKKIRNTTRIREIDPNLILFMYTCFFSYVVNKLD